MVGCIWQSTWLIRETKLGALALDLSWGRNIGATTGQSIVFPGGAVRVPALAAIHAPLCAATRWRRRMAGRMVGWSENKEAETDGGIVIMSWEGRKDWGGVGPPKQQVWGKAGLALAPHLPQPMQALP